MNEFTAPRATLLLIDDEPANLVRWLRSSTESESST